MPADNPIESSRLNQAIVIALGGNLPRPGETVQDSLEAAVRRLGESGFTVWARSRWWVSAAWPDPADPKFLNGVVLADSVHDPAAALAVLHQVEAEFGRERRRANAPRTLDLDLIAHGRARISGSVILPHPRAHERRFVMGPLAELAPDWVHPLLGATAATLEASASIGADAAPAQ